MNIIDVINPIVWVLANIALAYTSLVLVVFVILYYALFDPRATTGGTLIFRFMISLIGVVGLVFVSVYIDPTSGNGWFIYPEGIEPWRPWLRLFVYGYVGVTATSLAVLLVRRKWFPHKLKTAPEEELVKPRHETSEIAIIVKPRTSEANDN